MTLLKDLLREGESLLRREGVDSPLLSMHLLAAHVLKTTRLVVMTDGDCDVQPEEEGALQEMVRRRANGEPIAHLLKSREFYGLDFSVSSDVLIPRPETELLIDEVKKRFATEMTFDFADLGTGSGILAITLAVLFSQSQGLAVDVSLKALKIAQENAKRHGVIKRLLFSLADFRMVMGKRRFDVILSNPPYIARHEIERLSREVRFFEPRIALESGETGLEALWNVKLSAEQMLKSQGWLMMELGSKQSEVVGEWFKKSPAWCHLEISHDLAGLPRVLIAQRTGC